MSMLSPADTNHDYTIARTVATHAAVVNSSPARFVRSSAVSLFVLRDTANRTDLIVNIEPPTLLSNMGVSTALVTATKCRGAIAILTIGTGSGVDTAITDSFWDMTSFTQGVSFRGGTTAFNGTAQSSMTLKSLHYPDVALGSTPAFALPTFPAGYTSVISSSSLDPLTGARFVIPKNLELPDGVNTINITIVSENWIPVSGGSHQVSFGCTLMSRSSLSDGGDNSYYQGEKTSGGASIQPIGHQSWRALTGGSGYYTNLTNIYEPNVPVPVTVANTPLSIMNVLPLTVQPPEGGVSVPMAVSIATGLMMVTNAINPLTGANIPLAVKPHEDSDGMPVSWQVTNKSVGVGGQLMPLQMCGTNSGWDAYPVAIKPGTWVESVDGQPVYHKHQIGVFQGNVDGDDRNAESEFNIKTRDGSAVKVAQEEVASGYRVPWLVSNELSADGEIVPLSIHVASADQNAVVGVDITPNGNIAIVSTTTEVYQA